MMNDDRVEDAVRHAATIRGIRRTAAAALFGLLGSTTAGLAQTMAQTTTHAPHHMAAAVVPNQYSTEILAKAHCPLSPVVWANNGSRAYHVSGTKYYGKTKHGAYMCQKDADSGGFHVVKGEAAGATH